MLGDWNLLTTLLYILGIVLLIIEGLMPGFGVAGISGIVCVFISIFMITSNLYGALLLLLITFVLMALSLFLLYKFGFGTKYMKYIVLKTEQKNKDGYTSAKNYQDYIGRIVQAETILRPSGSIIIDGRRMDAVTQGEFIEKGNNVEIIKVEGSTLVVKKINKEVL